MLENPEVSAYGTNLGFYVIVGGICGSNYGSIKRCATIATYEKNNIYGYISSSSNEYYIDRLLIGGISGRSLENSVIEECYNSCKIVGDFYGKRQTETDGGGIVGNYSVSKSSISNCYNVGKIVVNHVNGDAIIGGLVGDNWR